MVADNPDEKIELKAFHCEIINDHEALKEEDDSFKEIPTVTKLDHTMIRRNYVQVK